MGSFVLMTRATNLSMPSCSLYHAMPSSDMREKKLFAKFVRASPDLHAFQQKKRRQPKAIRLPTLVFPEQPERCEHRSGAQS